MMSTKQPSLTASIGTKLTPKQFAAVQTKAATKGIGISEYIRQTLLSTLAQADTISPTEALLRAQLEEVLALRLLMLNLAALQAKGNPLTPELLEAVRAYADEHKAERARLLLEPTTHNQTQLTAESKNKEVA